MKVTLLGDSIRQLGYGKLVPELLGEGFEVFQTEENCRFAKYTLRMLYDYKDKMAGSDIVHWNNGLWDICADRVHLSDKGKAVAARCVADAILAAAKEIS